MTKPVTLQVLGSGASFGVYDGQTRVSRLFTCWSVAAAKANRLEREARAQDRPCLRCGKPHRSLGPQHRLCGRCRAVARRAVG